MREHSISLRLKIRPELVDGLNNIRKIRGLSMNEAVNAILASALVAEEHNNERIDH